MNMLHRTWSLMLHNKVTCPLSCRLYHQPKMHTYIDAIHLNRLLPGPRIDRYLYACLTFFHFPPVLLQTGDLQCALISTQPCLNFLGSNRCNIYSYKHLIFTLSSVLYRLADQFFPLLTCRRFPSSPQTQYCNAFQYALSCHG
jgi:hypothetical protein